MDRGTAFKPNLSPYPVGSTMDKTEKGDCPTSPAVVWLLLGDCWLDRLSARGGAGRGIIWRGGGNGGGVSGSPPSSVMIMLAWEIRFLAGRGGGTGVDGDAAVTDRVGFDVDDGSEELMPWWLDDVISGRGGGTGAALHGTLVRIIDCGRPRLWKEKQKQKKIKAKKNLSKKKLKQKKH